MSKGRLNRISSSWSLGQRSSTHSERQTPRKQRKSYVIYTPLPSNKIPYMPLPYLSSREEQKKQSKHKSLRNDKFHSLNRSLVYRNQLTKRKQRLKHQSPIAELSETAQATQEHKHFKLIHSRLKKNIQLLQKKAQQYLNQGPPKLLKQDLRHLNFMVSSLIGKFPDFRDKRRLERFVNKIRRFQVHITSLESACKKELIRFEEVDIPTYTRSPSRVSDNIEKSMGQTESIIHVNRYESEDEESRSPTQYGVRVKEHSKRDFSFLFANKKPTPN